MTRIEAATATGAVQFACVREISDCTVIRTRIGSENASSITTRRSVWPRIANTVSQTNMGTNTGP